MKLMNMSLNLRIGLDIDDVLCKWEESYCAYYNITSLFEHSQEEITYNVENDLINNKAFWINLPKKHKIDFYPELYCTKRCIPINWTEEFLKNNGFPIRPIIQIAQSDNKSSYLKNKVDLFIDDSISNFNDITSNNIKCLLMDSKCNKHFRTKYRIHTITKHAIVQKMQKVFAYPDFSNIVILINYKT